METNISLVEGNLMTPPPPAFPNLKQELPSGKPPQSHNLHSRSLLCCPVGWWFGPDLLHRFSDVWALYWIWMRFVKANRAFN